MNRKIIIIDDEDTTRISLQKRLAKAGFDAHSLPSAVNCIDYIEEHKIEVVLMDNLMPDITGLEALVEIRRKYSSSELPIIMVTSKQESKDIVEALSSGANDFIGKPVDLDIAAARINTQLKILDLNKDAMKKKELETLGATVATYNHEINNPLVVAYGNLRPADKITDINIDKIRYALDRIANMVKKISEIMEKEELETTNYVGEVNMLNLDKKKASGD